MFASTDQVTDNYMAQSACLQAQTLNYLHGKNADPDLNPDFHINLYSDLDVWWITVKILWIHYLGVRHFTECRKN